MKTLKIIGVSVGVISLILILLGVGSIAYDSWYDRQFYDIELPQGLEVNKPIEHLTQSQIDSLERITVNSNKLIVTGTGYTGYDFYMWYKPKEQGEIFIKGFELTTNKRLSEFKLTNRTTNAITSKSTEYQLFKGSTVIDEGTFEKYYPVRFELWFKSKDGVEKKLTETSYLIDGWDR